MTSKILVPSLLLSVCALACQGEEPSVEETSTSARAQRIEREAGHIRERIERLGSPAEHALLLEQIAPLTKLTDDEGQPVGEIRLDDEDSILRAELLFHLTWNRPRVGRDEPLATDFEAPDHPIHVIEHYARELKARGIDFLVVPVPSRVETYPERLRLEVNASQLVGDRGFAQFLLELTQRDVETIDLFRNFEGARYVDDPDDDRELFFHYDHHWTQRGMELAADDIAARVREMEWFEPGPFVEGEHFERRTEVAGWKLFSKYAPESTPVAFRRVVNADGGRAHQKSKDSPILLLGDSFAAQYKKESCDLASQLFARLGTPIDTITVSAGGSTKVWETLARRDDPFAGKKLVIWVFHSRALGNAKMQVVKVFGD